MRLQAFRTLILSLFFYFFSFQLYAAEQIGIIGLGFQKGTLSNTPHTYDSESVAAGISLKFEYRYKIFSAPIYFAWADFTKHNDEHNPTDEYFNQFSLGLTPRIVGFHHWGSFQLGAGLGLFVQFTLGFNKKSDSGSNPGFGPYQPVNPSKDVLIGAHLSLAMMQIKLSDKTFLEIEPIVWNVPSLAGFWQPSVACGLRF